MLHASVKSISRRNSILALKVSGVLMEGVTNVRQKVMINFIEMCKVINVVKPRIDCIVFCSLSVGS